MNEIKQSFESIIASIYRKLSAQNFASNAEQKTFFFIAIALCMLKRGFPIPTKGSSREVFEKNILAFLKDTNAKADIAEQITACLKDITELPYEELVEAQAYIDKNGWRGAIRALEQYLRYWMPSLSLCLYAEGIPELFQNWFVGSDTKEIDVISGMPNWLELLSPLNKTVTTYQTNYFNRAIWTVMTLLYDVQMKEKGDFSVEAPRKEKRNFICDAPWGVLDIEKGRNFRYVDLNHAETCLESYVGRGIMMFPPARAMEPSAKKLRIELLEKQCLHAVIQLPAKTRSSTNIETVVFCVDTTKKADKVLFVDLRDESFFNFGREQSTPKTETADALQRAFTQETSYSKRVQVADLLRNDADLNVSSYVRDEVQSKAFEKLEMCKTTLDSIASITRVQMIGPDVDKELTAYEISASDIDEYGMIAQPQKRILIPTIESSNRIKDYLVQEGDILFAIKGSVCKVGLVPGHGSEKWIAGQSFVVIRLESRESISPIYLFRYMKSKTVQTYLRSFVRGAHVPFFPMDKLKKLPVHIPSPVELNNAEKQHSVMAEKLVEIARLQEEIEAINDNEF